MPFLLLFVLPHLLRVSQVSLHLLEDVTDALVQILRREIVLYQDAVDFYGFAQFFFGSVELLEQSIILTRAFFSYLEPW